MANVESGNWILKAAEREQVREADQEEKRRALVGGKCILARHPGKVRKTFLRELSIVRIIIAVMTSGVRLSSYLCFVIKYLTDLYRV